MLDCVAPYGLSDLLKPIVRPNRVQVTKAIYDGKVRAGENSGLGRGDRVARHLMSAMRERPAFAMMAEKALPLRSRATISAA
ncbi:MAG: hypothetical protein WDN24_15740 [Sphingomonas sp.]